MNGIRVTYSGLIGLGVSLLGVITGTIFVILVTRKLTPDDFGIWTLIGSIVAYVLVIEPIITYWSTRQIARGEEIGKTAITTGGVFSLCGIMAYFGIALFVAYSTGVDLFILAIAALLIPVTFANGVVTSICMGFKPQAVSYGLITFETTKIPLGFLFVAFMGLGIIGVLVATILSSSIRLILLIILSREKLIGSIKKSVIKFWLKLSWLTIFLSAAGLIYKLDVLIFSILTNSFLGLAYWGVSQTSSKFVGHSSQLSAALYPKLLSGGKIEIAEQNLKRTLYFAIPLLAFSIVFAKPALHILNPIYVDGVFIVAFISLRTFSAQIMTFFYNILSGYEKVDENKQATFKQYIKSKLFFLPSLSYILSISYVSALTIFLLFFKTDEMSEIFLVTVWAIFAFVVTIPFVAYGYITVKKQYKIKFPSIPILKYSFVTLLASFVVYTLLDYMLTYPQSIFQFIPEIIPVLIIAGAIYFGITYLIDNSTRQLFKSIIKEITKR